MAKYIGQCKNCGSDQHPKGNVFRIMRDYEYDLEFPHREAAPTETVKVCNNCNTAHSFKRRVSARQRKLVETAAGLLQDSAA